MTTTPITTNHGETFTRRDAKRAGLQLECVRAVMIGEMWRTLEQITTAARLAHERITGEDCQWTAPAISARLRDLRKAGPGRPPVTVDRKTVDGVVWYLVRNVAPARTTTTIPPAPKVCTWTCDIVHDKWDTTCLASFCLMNDTPLENHMRFCCYCGLRLKEKLP